MKSFPTIIVFVCLMIMGIGLMPLLTVQLHPSSPTRDLNVSYHWSGASALVVEREVTSRLEALFSSMKGIENVSSVSAQGYGDISLTFKKKVNQDAMRFEIAGLIRQVYPGLPAGVSYPQLSTNIYGYDPEAILTYTINGSGSPHFMKRYADKIIVPALAKIKGVSEVHVYGATPYVIEIVFSQQKARELSISGDDMAQAVNSCFQREFIGKIIDQQMEGTYPRELSLYIEKHMRDTVQWDHIPVRKVGGRIIYLTDVATIRYREQLPSSYYRINGLNTINLTIYPEKGVNALALAKVVREKMSAIGRNPQSGYTILLANDSTEYLSKEINTILFRCAISLGIVILLILIASRQVRYLLVTLVSIAATLLISCALFYFFSIDLQFYSLAGITVSLGMIVGNSIIMIDHARRAGNRKVFLAIFASTLVTIAALGTIFFLPADQKSNLVEFALVIIINLTVSFAVAFYFIPALIDKIQLTSRRRKTHGRRARRMVRWVAFYGRAIRFNKRIKWVYIVLLVLGFGLPVYRLPGELTGEGGWVSIYNTTIGDRSFQEEIRPVIEKVVGGTLRLFSREIFAKSYASEPARTALHVHGKMPEGCTVQQLDEAMRLMENFLTQFDKIELFHTHVWSYDQADITIYFKPQYEFSSFPHFLKSVVEEKAVGLGGTDIDVYGVGQGFSTSLGDGYQNSRLTLEGYDYEQLYRFATLLKTNLLKNPRIHDAGITDADWWNKANYEFFVDFDKEQLARNGISAEDFYRALQDKNYQRRLNPAYIRHEQYAVDLRADTYGEFTRWNFGNDPLKIRDDMFRLGRAGRLDKQKTGSNIHKTNQQYILNVTYDFIGSYALARRVKQQHMDSLKAILPVGYTIKGDEYGGWDRSDDAQYYYILLAIVVIYFICTILFESLLQPLAVLCMIPVSFVGVFLTFYLFDVNFDQGGYASFIFLSGLVVNSGLYIVNDYNNFKVVSPQNGLRLYLRAFRHKIAPVIMALLSISLCLVSFIIDGRRETFWFAFSAGIMGGLLFSIIGVIVFLPIFLPLSIKMKGRKHVPKS